MINNTDRMQFFALSTLLEALCAPQSVRELENLYAVESDRRRKSGLILGYKSVIKAVLYRQIELIIGCPEILGMRRVDSSLSWWWLNSESKYANRFGRVMSEDPPKSALIGNYLNNLLLGVNRSGHSFERFSQTAATVCSFAQTSLTMVAYCRLSIAEESNSAQVLDVIQTLRLCAAEYLHDFIYHNFSYDRKDRTLDDSDLYANPNSQSWEDGDVLEDFGMSHEIETSKDIVGRRPTNRHTGNRYSFLGINAAVAISLYGIGLQSQVLYRECEGLIPDDELYAELLDEFHSGKYPSQKYRLALHAEIPEETLKPIMSSISSPIDPIEQLTDLLGNRAFLMGSLRSYSHSAFHFQSLLNGLLLSTPRGQRIEVLRIDHSSPPDDRHPPISLAVQMDGDWQVFYSIDAIGRMKSPVWPLIESLGTRINLTRIEGVDSNDLLRLCDRAFQYVASQLKAQTDINSHLRGTIPELLASLLLANTGYHHFRTSLELKGIGELDAIGIRNVEEGGECLLVEVKKSSTTQNQLISELDKFAKKVETVRENCDAVNRALGYSGSIRRVSGLFITMADVGELVSEDTEGAPVRPHRGFIDDYFLHSGNVEAEFKSYIDSLQDIRFWDYSQFNIELKSAELPELPIRLLKRAEMSWELPEVDIGEWPDAFGILAQAVERDDWQWPGSIDAVQDKLDEVLRGEESQHGRSRNG